MTGNTGASKYEKFYTTRRSEMAAFDRLPRYAREVLSQANHNFATSPAAEELRELPQRTVTARGAAFRHLLTKKSAEVAKADLPANHPCIERLARRADELEAQL